MKVKIKMLFLNALLFTLFIMSKSLFTPYRFFHMQNTDRFNKEKFYLELGSMHADMSALSILEIIYVCFYDLKILKK